MKKIIYIVFGLLFSLTSFADSVDYHSLTSLRDFFPHPKTKIVNPSMKPGLFNQSVDHFGLTAGQTFKQRYWINSDYAANKNAPVIYHICGEGAADEDYFLQDNAIEWAKELGAHIVYLEHRYYGESLPFADLSTDHLKYLTLNNAIEDLASFQRALISQGYSGKWISVGGSYSGTLSAIYRLKHPELVVGALAASAPMIAGTGKSEGSAFEVATLSSTKPKDGQRQWVYQSCVDFTFWIAMGMTVYQPSRWLCTTLFNGAPAANSAFYNLNYYQPYLNGSLAAASNILFTYGSGDVWTSIGLTESSNANPKITIRTILAAGHHEDLNAPKADDTTQILQAREEFLQLAHDWLR